MKNYNIYTFLIIFPKVKHGKESQSYGIIQAKILFSVTKASEKILHTIFQQYIPRMNISFALIIIISACLIHYSKQQIGF